ncbi:sensor histidine kinase [Chitinimonas sp.]|uniref:sensor histidine kinase n=1 Tax=Chitinimonas sp. TaxID=1934313 RepID=UPI0035B2DCEA
MKATAHPSLRRQLLMWLLAPQLVLWLAAAVVSYYVAVRHANLAIDQSLAQSSRALARQVKPFGDGLYIDFPAAAREILEEDPKDKLHYMVSAPPGQFLLGDQRLPAPPFAAKFDTPLFYDGHMAGKAVRVAALYLRIGTAEHPQVMLVQVAKGTAARAALAAEILTDTVTPLALLMLATSFVVWMGIARGLQPLRKLRRQVENRSPRDLTPLELDNAPTEVTALVHALNALLSEVGKQVERQKRFIADAAHQLRTPLAGLKSQTEVAQRELAEAQPDLDSLRQRLNRLETSADRGIRLVNQLLALARAEPDAPLSMAPLDLARLLRELAREVAPRALAKRLDLAVDGLDRPLLISGHEGLLRELFANLLNNAVAYTPAGGEITLTLADQRSTALVTVADTGPGIPASERDAVFERFYRGALQANEHGCGLGLPIAREIARRHGASIALGDSQPHGLQVSLTFPLTTV